jgi:hypothetical protein
MSGSGGIKTYMTTGDQCLCVHIKTSAIIITIIGIIFSLLQCITAVFVWIYIPFAILMLSSYILGLVGILRGRPKMLRPVEIYVGFNIALNVIVCITLIAFGAILPMWLVDYFTTEDWDCAVVYENGDFQDAIDDCDDAKTAARTASFVIAFVVFLSIAYNILAFIIIYRCRHWLLQNLSTSYIAPSYPYGYGNPPQQLPMQQQQVFQTNPPPPNQQFQPGYPQQIAHQIAPQSGLKANTQLQFQPQMQQYQPPQQHQQPQPQQQVQPLQPQRYQTQPQQFQPPPAPPQMQQYQPRQYQQQQQPQYGLAPQQYNQQQQQYRPSPTPSPLPQPDYDTNVKF